MEVVVYTSPKDVDTLDHYITFRDWPSRTFHFDEVLHHVLSVDHQDRSSSAQQDDSQATWPAKGGYLGCMSGVRGGGRWIWVPK